MTAFFISDAHLGSGPKQEERLKEDRLLEFFEHVSQRGTFLFIVGDLFDAWFEYRYVIPKGYHRVLTALENLVRRGITIHYLAGNHDYWMGNYFSDYLGIQTHREDLAIELDGKKFYLHHGDGLAHGDRGYRILRQILRNRFNVWLYSWIHPDLGLRLAKASSRTSRKHGSQREQPNDRGMEEFARKKIAGGFDFVIMGHQHQPASISMHGGRYVNLGDWMNTYTYAVYMDGNLELKSWNTELTGQ